MQPLSLMIQCLVELAENGLLADQARAGESTQMQKLPHLTGQKGKNCMGKGGGWVKDLPNICELLNSTPAHINKKIIQMS